MFLALALLAPPAWARGRHHHQGRADEAPPTSAGGFDYYVLSLSWSPAFCAADGARSPDQCGPGRHYGFVVHGLWPQNERGYPASCPDAAPLPAGLDAKMLDLMPSLGLVRHEWQKHGSCSGLAPDRYFSRVRAAFAAVKIPASLRAPTGPVEADLAQVERLFVDANPGLAPEMLAVQCKRFISEVRVCLDKELKFRRCGSDVRDSCRGRTTFPPVR